MKSGSFERGKESATTRAQTVDQLDAAIEWYDAGGAARQDEYMGHIKAARAALADVLRANAMLLGALQTLHDPRTHTGNCKVCAAIAKAEGARE